MTDWMCVAQEYLSERNDKD